MTSISFPFRKEIGDSNKPILAHHLITVNLDVKSFLSYDTMRWIFLSLFAGDKDYSLGGGGYGFICVVVAGGYKLEACEC